MVIIESYIESAWAFVCHQKTSVTEFDGQIGDLALVTSTGTRDNFPMRDLIASTSRCVAPHSNDGIKFVEIRPRRGKQGGSWLVFGRI